MKKTKLLKLLITAIFCTLMIVSCSDNDNETHGNFEDINKELGKNKNFLISVQYDDEETYGWILSFRTYNYKKPELDITLRIDDEVVDWDIEHYNEEDNSFTKRSYSLGFVRGETYNFNLLVNGVTRTGNLKIPHEIIFTDPEINNQTKRYKLNWEIEANPRIQIVYYGWRSWGEYADSDNAEATVKPSTRSYNIPSGFVHENWFYMIHGIFTLNYSENKDVLFSSFYDDLTIIFNTYTDESCIVDKPRGDYLQYRDISTERLLQIINP